MRLTDALLGEHGVLYALFSDAERRAREATDLAALKGALDAVGVSLLAHARLEEDTLFPELAQVLGPHGPVEVMLAEHQEIDAGFERIQGAATVAEARELLDTALEVTRGHFMKEEEVLFQMAQRMLGDDRLGELGSRWAEARGVRVG